MVGHSFMPEVRDRRVKLQSSDPTLGLLDGFKKMNNDSRLCATKENIVSMFYLAHTLDQSLICDLGLENNSVDHRMSTSTKRLKYRPDSVSEYWTDCVWQQHQRM